MEQSHDALAAMPVISTWTFELDPSRFDEFVSRVRQALAQLPGLTGWLSTDLLANDKRSHVMILSKWESRDAWGAAQWTAQIETTLGDLFERSRHQDFQLYLHIAP